VRLVGECNEMKTPKAQLDNISLKFSFEYFNDH